MATKHFLQGRPRMMIQKIKLKKKKTSHKINQPVVWYRGFFVHKHAVHTRGFSAKANLDRHVFGTENLMQNTAGEDKPRLLQGLDSVRHGGGKLQSISGFGSSG